MSLFKLTPTGDLDRGPNGVGFSRVEGPEEARVHLYTLMQIVQPECKRNKRAGLNLQWMLAPGTPNDHVANHLASLMVNVPGIVDVVLKYNFDGKLGIFAVESQVTYDAVDQAERRTEQENFLIDVNSLTGQQANG